jgi:integrase
MQRKTPSYCLHKASGQAVVRIDGKDHYLGIHGSAESYREHDRLIAEWLSNGRRLTLANTVGWLTIEELMARYWRWAENYYRDADGESSQELDNIRLALRPLRRLYGQTEAAAFGPLALRAIQDDLVKAGLSRRVINARVNRIRRMFKWGVSHELIPASIHESLSTVPGLKRGRSNAHETTGVMPVSDQHVNATLPYMPPPVRAMVQLQRLTGCRPGEVMAIRAMDINMNGPVWIYRPANHKNTYRGLDRTIPLGPQAREIIKPFLTTALDEHLFNPRAHVDALHRRRTEQRKSKRPPSQLARRRKAKPLRAPADRYNRRSYRIAIIRAADKATRERVFGLLKPLAESGKLVLPDGLSWESVAARRSLLTADRICVIAAANGLESEVERLRVPHWSPLRLRHTAATVIRARYGIEAAKAVLGHTRVETSEIYAERDMTQAAQIMAEIG